MHTSGNGFSPIFANIFAEIQQIKDRGKTYDYSEVEDHKAWLEQNSNSYYRLRWMKKTNAGAPVFTTSGSYARGSRYVRKQEREEVRERVAKSRGK